MQIDTMQCCIYIPLRMVALHFSQFQPTEDKEISGADNDGQEYVGDDITA